MNADKSQHRSSLSQQQLLNQKYNNMLNRPQPPSLPHHTQHKFTQAQLQTISKRFNQLCNNQQTMNYQQFRRGLGLLGRQDSFICRIFNLIDHDSDGRITVDNYINYLSIILKGSDLEKSRFGWLILTENRGDMQLKDFMELFQQLSVVWNSLTGQIVIPKKKYVEELFNTFDVDQDQTITFTDYRLFFDEHLQFSGWFEYFNGINIDEQMSKAELEKVRQRLRNKLKIEGQEYMQQSAEEMKIILHDSEFNIEKKLYHLTKNMKQQAEQIRKQREQITSIDQKEDIDELERMSYSSRHFSTNQRTQISSDEPSMLSIKSFYKYNHDGMIKESPINKIHMRKQQIKRQTKSTLNHEVARQLKGYLNSTYKLMDLCHNYRMLKQKQKAYSPTKLKQMEVKLNFVQKPQTNEEEDPKKKMTVYFGHQNWNLVLNIMVGLRKSITALTNVKTIEQNHFTEQHEFYLGNKAFLSGRGPQALKNMESFLFISMSPYIFQRLRKQYGVSNIEYQRSVGPEGLLNQILTGDLTALNEKCSTGKSGAFFYLTSDNRIFLKTLPKHEFIFFTNIIQNYYKHMTEHSNTLIVRIYGLYKLKIYQNKQKIDTIYFISMENIFWKVKAQPRCKIQEVYDLKGSLYGRQGSDGGQLKDQDWLDKGKMISLPLQLSQIFRDQITADSRFFKKNNINDYSLMVAYVNYQGKLTPSEESNLFKRIKGGILSRQKGILYVLSIIDILTVFQTRKNLEYLFKSTFLSKDVSCIPPSDYCARFRAFIQNSID